MGGFAFVIPCFCPQAMSESKIHPTAMVDPSAEVMMTDSGKCAYYAPGELDIRIAFGGMGDCVRSAVEGRVRREDGPWKDV